MGLECNHNKITGLGTKPNYYHLFCKQREKVIITAMNINVIELRTQINKNTMK